MKVFLTILVLVVAFYSCQFSVKDKGQSDLGDTNVENTLDSGGNQVKSEAPDATTKTEQGYALPRFDDGMAQSPINLLNSTAKKEQLKKFNIKFTIEITAAENLGHTIQLDFKEGSTSVADGKLYLAKQFHFHTPSEHLIDGMTYPMEMHIVNLLKEADTSKSPKYLVVGILFKMGRENKFIKEFINAIPKQENTKVLIKPGTVVFKDIFNHVPNNELGNYFAYKGSLTTPPYTESVDWIIRKYILEASPEQISAIEKMEGDNARHVQAMYERKVASSSEN